MLRRTLLGVVILGRFALCNPQISSDKTEASNKSAEVLRQIDIDRIKSSLVFLASDSLQGRETAGPGEKKAAEFIASQFKSFGLKPLGDSGTYFQHFTVSTYGIGDSTFVEGDGKYFRFGKDVLLSPFGAGDTTITAPVVFAGYGFESDSSSDYDGIDARGKIVMLLDGNPKSADTADPMVRTGLYKRSNAMRHGAVAIIIIVRGGDAGFSKLQERMGSLFGAKSMTLESEAKGSRRATSLQMLYMKESAADDFLKRTGVTTEQIAAGIDSAKIPAMKLLDKATVNVRLEFEKRQSENIVGVLEGSDPDLKNEYVVYSAHYDHLGMTNSGMVYHGADDNASGTSTVIGIANAYSKSNAKPKRSIMFLTVSGEEKGLLGSDYFTNHPVVPIKDIVADLNTDMDGRIDTGYVKSPTDYIYVIGSKRLSSELDSLLVAADSESVRIKLDYSFDSDNDPNKYYYRSDHYNFARRNIPVIFFFDGNNPDYHKPTDTSDKIDFRLMKQRASLILMTGWKVANIENRLRPN